MRRFNRLTEFHNICSLPPTDSHHPTFLLTCATSRHSLCYQPLSSVQRCLRQTASLHARALEVKTTSRSLKISLVSLLRSLSPGQGSCLFQTSKTRAESSSFGTLFTSSFTTYAENALQFIHSGTTLPLSILPPTM